MKLVCTFSHAQPYFMHEETFKPRTLFYSTKNYRMGDFEREIFCLVLCVKKHVGKTMHPCKPTEVENKSWRFQRQNFLSYFICEETFIYVTLHLANQERRGKLGLEILNAKISTYFMHEEIFLLKAFAPNQQRSGECGLKMSSVKFLIYA